MKIVKLGAALLSTVGLVWALNANLNVKGAPIPAFGKLLSPFVGFWQNGEALSQTPTDEAFAGLKGNVKVVYDDRDVPHIFADNVTDAVFVQGYLHAKNRLWEMDFISRVASGRLSEVLGNRNINGRTTAEIDRLMRRRGIARGAENTLSKWQTDTENFPYLESYVAGANAYISNLKSKDIPLEYKILGVTPEAWSPLKVALMAKYLAIDLALRDDDLQATNAKALLGADFDAVFPEYFPEQSPIVPSGTPFTKSATVANAAPTGADVSMLPFDTYSDLKPDASNGSNNWVVSGSKTLSGKPILCGDPHLSLRLPSVWYELQIITPELNTYGVSLPGVPLILIGFNNHIAWTMTNVGHDVADWYSIKWKDDSRTEYLLDGNYQKAELRVEEIKIKDAPSVFDTVRYTNWGPVVFTDSTGWKDMAFHWLANEVPEIDLRFSRKLNAAKNYDEYSEALTYMNVPAQNVAFACQNGDIALKVNGTFPIKNKGQGRFVQDGSNSANAWKGFIPRSDIPQYKNPSRGFVSSANQHSTDPSYPYYYNSEGFEPYRGRIINRLLSQMDSVKIEDMMRLQNNNYGLMPEEAMPQLFGELDESALNDAEKAVCNVLKTWDRNYEANAEAPIYFEEWYKAYYDETWDEILKHPNAANLLRPTSWHTIYMLRDEPNNKFFDRQDTPDKKEVGKDVVTAAFKKMVAELPKIKAEIAAKYPQNPTFVWAHYKDTEIPHVSNFPGLGRFHLLNGGHGKAINAVKKSHGPSWRMIVEVGDTPRAFVVYPGGQSGNPGNKNFDQFVDKWTKGEYYEAIYLKSADEKNARLAAVQNFNKK